MSKQWFQRVGKAYWPVSTMGGVASLAGVALCIDGFMAINRHSHSNTDTRYGVFPYFACSLLLLDWLAPNTSIQRGDAS